MSDWYECPTCWYGTNSEAKMDAHEDEHIKARNRDVIWADIPLEYREFFYDSTLEG